MLVGLAVLGVILYELRTLFEFVGISVPIVPYMMGVLFVLVGVLVYISLFGNWDTESYHGNSR